MHNERHTMSDQKITGESHVKSCDRIRTNACRTRPLVDDYYLCLANRIDCEYVSSFGMSYLCNSFERQDFSRHSDINI